LRLDSKEALVPKLDNITEIDADDPIEIILQIDRKIRPAFNSITTQGEIDEVFAYYDTMKHACELFDVKFDVAEPAGRESIQQARSAFVQTKAAIDRKQIDLLAQKKAGGVVLDDTWRAKIHSYLAVVRGIVDRAAISPDLKDSILSKLHSLDAEVDRTRTRAQKFAETLVSLCAAVGAGARELEPAIKLIERIAGAIERATPKPMTLALPPPEDYGLDSEIRQLPDRSDAA
jgi:hypothetical protein